MSAILAALLPYLVPALGSVITALLGWATSSLAKRNAAATAAGRLTQIAIAMAGRLWDSLAPEVQAIVADGKVAAEERASFQVKVRELARDFVAVGELEKIASALGLPLAGVIASLANSLIERFARAHDPAVTTESAKAYPVNAGIQVPAAEPAALAAGEGAP